MRKVLFGVDWGGTRVKIGAVDFDGTILRHDIIAVDRALSAEEQYAVILLCLRRLAEAMGKPAAIGLGLTGVTDPNRGVVLLPGKIRGMEGFPIVPRLRNDFDVPVWADNDGQLAMYAERFAGHAKECSWAVTVTIGTGIGSGVLIDGRIIDDPHLMFGMQIGHLVVDMNNDKLSLIGTRGTAELLCSATALVLAVRSGLQHGIPSVLSERYWEDPGSVDFRSIIEDGVAANDALCIDELNRWTKQLGWLLVNVVHAYSPEIIILAGGAIGASRFFINELRAHVRKYVFRYPRGEEVPIRISEFGELSGLVGAALMARERLKTLREGEVATAG
ncbi:MAG: ROK family protein [Terracidiphilus sp.]|nr:ROK family protein [Terracidiphilus sp.]